MSGRHVGTSLSECLWKPLQQTVTEMKNELGQSLTAAQLRTAVWECCQRCLKTFSKESLDSVVSWKNDGAKLTQKETFLRSLPSVVISYKGEPSSLSEAVSHLKSLLNAHGGELISTATEPRWKLFPTFDQSLTIEDGLVSGIHQQFRLFPDNAARKDQGPAGELKVSEQE